MQILEIIIYGRNGEKRVLPLRAGSVNIITGQVHTGKTALIPIISYCLGGGSFHVPEGRIVETSAWFGLLLQTKAGRIFVARENPYPGRSSTSTAYLDRNVTESPAVAPDATNTSLDAFEAILTSILGIAPNLHVPPNTSTRLPLSANIRHALFYCFQHQTEIANNHLLFHRQATDFLTPAIRDTLPYFLGAIREDELAREEELSAAKRNLRLLEVKQNENELIQGTGVSKAVALLKEAVSVGLLPAQSLPETMAELRSLMQRTLVWTPGQASFAGEDQIAQYQEEISILREQRSNLAENIRTAKAASGDAQGFVDEARIQAERLESIGLFDSENDHESCPLCTQHLSVPVPNADAIRQSLSQLSGSLLATERERPRLREYVAKLNTDLERLTDLQMEKENVVTALQNEQEAATEIRDLNARRAKVIGRFSLYLESVPLEPLNNQLQRDIDAARLKVARLAGQLEPAQKAERLNSILNRLGSQMWALARSLELEFSDSPVRLDVNAVTVVVDTVNRPVPLLLLGSAENWLGCHLITHLALHRHFREQNRPVPGFLVLDQPTQVYYPPDLDPHADKGVESLPDDDRRKVALMFQVIFKAVADIAPDFQIIITDHADLLADQTFQDCIVEKWRGPGKALIPASWYDSRED